MLSAICNGFQHHFPDLDRIWCVRHLSERSESKLIKLLAKSNINASQREKSSSEILKDIYGNRDWGFYKFGLAEVSYKSGLDIKLFSLKEAWESLCPEFHDWFKWKNVMILWLALFRVDWCSRLILWKRSRINAFPRKK